jgi:hypothetical protein
LPPWLQPKFLSPTIRSFKTGSKWIKKLMEICFPGLCWYIDVARGNEAKKGVNVNQITVKFDKADLTGRGENK